MPDLPIDLIPDSPIDLIPDLIIDLLTDLTPDFITDLPYDFTFYYLVYRLPIILLHLIVPYFDYRFDPRQVS